MSSDRNPSHGLETTKLMMPLEDRLMFDAAGLVAMAETPDVVEAWDGAAPAAEATADEQLLTELMADFVPPADRSREIVFVDSAVEDPLALLGDVATNTEIITLDADLDGVAQIADILGDRDDISAIHIVSHGGSGELLLGSEALNLDTMDALSTQLASWGDALAPGADILIYGCNVAEGDDGQAFVDQLAALTGADVAASDDITGSTELGGDTDLEVSSGPIETRGVLSLTAISNYDHILALPAAGDDSAFTSEDTSVDINFMSNDIDADGDTLLLVSFDATTTEGGTVIYEGNGVFNYTPLANFNSDHDLNGVVNEVGDTTDSFTYTIFDGNSGTSSATVTITVSPVTDAPIVVDYDAAAAEGNNIEVTAATLDTNAITDTDGDSNPTVSGVILTNTDVANGTVAYDVGTSKFTFTPADTDWYGTDSFTYEVSYGGGTETVTGTVNLTIHSVNDTPVLDNSGTPTLTTVVEESSGGNGDLVSSLVSGLITDDDSDSVEGVAVTGADDTNGDWEYSTDSGATWASLTTANGGALSDASAVLLLPTDKVRFVPGADYNSNDGASGNLTFKAWDRATGTAGDVDVDTGVGDAYSVASEDYTIVVTPDNDTPVVTPAVAQTVAEDATLNFPAMSITDADADESAGAQQITVTMAVTNGTLSLDGDISALTFTTGNGTADATMTFTADTADVHTVLQRTTHAYNPTANYAGSDTLTITAVDTGVTGDAVGATTTETVAITVTDVNDAPVVTVPAGQAPGEDTPLTFTGGTAISIADSDAGASDILQVMLSVDQGGSLTLSQGTGLTIPAGGSGTDSVTIQGTLTNINAALDGMVYQGAADSTTGETLTVTADDLGNTGGGALTHSDTVAITLTAVNDAPSPVADTATMLETAGPLTTGVLTGTGGNDTDIDDNVSVLTITSIDSLSGSGGAIINAGDDTKIDYTPAANFTGTEVVTFTVSDDGGGTASSTLTVTVNPDYDEDTVANVDAQTVAEDSSATTVNVLSNDYRVGTTPETFTVTVNPNNGGTATVVGNAIEYTPAADFAGTETFTYQVKRDAGAVGTGTETDTAVVTMTVTAANDAPSLTVPGAQSTTEDVMVSITGASIADVDAASSNIQMTVTATSGTVQLGGSMTGITLTSGANDGSSSTLTVAGTVTNLNTALASIDYLGASNDNGTDTISITVSDLGNTGTGSTLTDTDTIAVTITAADDIPTNGSDVTGETVVEDGTVDIDLLDGYTDGNDGDTGVYVGNFSFPGGDMGSSVTLISGGTVRYEPGADLTGTEVFNFTIYDSNTNPAAASNTATVTITAVNDTPVAVNDTATTNESIATTIDVEANDSDVDGDLLFIPTFDTTSVFGGSVQLSGLGEFTYTPAAGFSGTDNFSYTLSDLSGATDTATVSVTVSANIPPVVVADTATTTEDTQVTGIVVLTNDTDTDGNQSDLSITDYDTSSAQGGTISFDAGTDTFTYTPATDYNGIDTFSYTITDLSGSSGQGTVTITVTAVNDAPIGEDDTVTTVEDADKLISVLANDYDTSDADTNLSVAGFDDSGLTLGAIMYNGDGTFTYTPGSNASGTDTFTYTVRDSGGLTDTSTVSITILAANDDPLAVDDIFGDGDTSNASVGVGDTITEDDTEVVLDVLANDSDVDDGSSLWFIPSFTTPDNGSLEYKADKTFLYTPDADWNGTDSFTYMVLDGVGGSATGTVTLQVTAGTDEPQVSNISKTGTEGDGSVTFVATDFSDQFYDVDTGGPGSLESIRVESLPDVADGTLELSGGNVAVDAVLTIADIANLTFEPASSDWNGSASFTWSGFDGTDWSLEADAATVTITQDAVNDTPVITTPGTQTVNEEVLLSITGVSIADADGGDVQITLDVNNGTLNLTGDTSNVTFDPAGLNNSSTVIMTGTTTNINSVLGNLTYLGDDNFYTNAQNTERLSVSVNDLSNGGGDALSATSNVTITVNNLLDAPTAVGDTVTVAENGSTTFTAESLMSNDIEVETESGTMTILSYNTPGNGTLSEADGVFTYTPNADYAGTDFFTYILDDGGNTDSTTVTITVSAVNSAPVLSGTPGDTQEVYADSSLILSGISAQDVDINGSDAQITFSATNGNISLNQTLGLTKITGDNGSSAMTYQGTLTAINNAISSVTYNPTAASGSDTITITINDMGNVGSGSELTDVETIAVTIREVNSDPVPTEDIFEIPADSPDGYEYITTDVTENDTDANSSNLFVASFTQPTLGGGTVTFMGNGKFKFTLDAGNFSTYDSFTYTVNDGEGSFIDSIIYITDDSTWDPSQIAWLELEEEEIGGGEEIMLAEADIPMEQETTEEEQTFQEQAPQAEAPMMQMAMVDLLGNQIDHAMDAVNLSDKMAKVGDAFEQQRSRLASAFGTLGTTTPVDGKAPTVSR